MATVKITDQEKAQLRENAKNEVERLEKILSDNITVQILDTFKNKFNICETAYKVVLAEHQRRKGNDTDCLKVYMTQVPHALAFAGYNFDKESNSSKAKWTKYCLHWMILTTLKKASSNNRSNQDDSNINLNRPDFLLLNKGIARFVNNKFSYHD